MDAKVSAKCSFALLVQRDVELSLLFIRAGVPALQCDAYGANALHLAARAGHLELVIALLKTGKFDINCKGQNEWTPLHESVSLRRIDVSKFLIQSGANGHALTNGGETVRALGTRLGLSKAELDDIIFLTTPISPNLVTEPASTTVTGTAASTTPTSDAIIPSLINPVKKVLTEVGKSASIPRLNLMDIIKKPKSSSMMSTTGVVSPTSAVAAGGVGAVGAGGVNGVVGSEKSGSFPSLSNNKVSNGTVVVKDEAAVV
ncbi:hypothetical protein HDU98_000344 [Podochytrium sp. JEL0797]|nr:hypothetical protein HDU98_000344 [Podochytrium sp. JEL0797]